MRVCVSSEGGTHAGLDDADDSPALGGEVAGAGRERAGVPEGAGEGAHHGYQHHLPVGGADVPAAQRQTRLSRC